MTYNVESPPPPLPTSMHQVNAKNKTGRYRAAGIVAFVSAVLKLRQTAVLASWLSPSPLPVKTPVSIITWKHLETTQEHTFECIYEGVSRMHRGGKPHPEYVPSPWAEDMIQSAVSSCHCHIFIRMNYLFLQLSFSDMLSQQHRNIGHCHQQWDGCWNQCHPPCESYILATGPRKNMEDGKQWVHEDTECLGRAQYTDLVRFFEDQCA